MSKLALRKTRTAVYQWFVVQMVVVLLVGALFAIFSSKNLFFTVLLGGLVCALPQQLHARWFLGSYRASQAKSIIRNFYLGEIVKLFLTGLLFILVIVNLPVSVPVFLIGFVSAQIAFWLAPYFVKIWDRS